MFNSENITISCIESPWNIEKKTYNVEEPIDFTFIDSINFNIITSSNLTHLLPLLKDTDFICFNHFFKQDLIRQNQHEFNNAYDYQFAHELIELSKFLTELPSTFKHIKPQLPNDYISLSNTHFLVPTNTKCFAISHA